MELSAPGARHGVVTRDADSLMVSRARDFLAGGPAGAPELVAAVCQLPGVSGIVAEHLASTLLASHDEFVCGDDGRWCLRPVAAAPAWPDGAEPRGRRLLDERFVVVDVETTGGRAGGGDRVTEFAAVAVEGGQVGEVFSTLINPQRAIPPWITNLTNITWDMVKDAPRFSDVCDRVTSFMEGRVFVAHNAPFDWRFVGAEVARATGRQLQGRQLCTVRLARRLLPQLPRRSLDMVAHHYGVEIAARHRAAGDAVATAHVLLRLLSDAADRGVERWGDLDAFMRAPAAPRRSRRRSALPGSARGGEGA